MMEAQNRHFFTDFDKASLLLSAEEKQRFFMRKNSEMIRKTLAFFLYFC